jgi:hypothetical protein
VYKVQATECGKDSIPITKYSRVTVAIGEREPLLESRKRAKSGAIVAWLQSDTHPLRLNYVENVVSVTVASHD